MIMLSHIFYSFLFILFLLGTAVLMFEKLRAEKISFMLRKALIGIFFANFSLYVIAGIMNMGFGWIRSFFYLLPVYFFVIFYFLKKIFKSKKVFYLICAGIIIFSLSFSLQRIFSWSENNLLREMVRISGDSKVFSFVVGEKSSNIWPFEYYAKKFNIEEKTRFLPAYVSEYDYLKGEQKFMDMNIGEFALIQQFPENLFENRKSRVFNEYHMHKSKIYAIETGPYLFLKKNIGLPANYVGVYFYKKKGGPLEN